MRACKKISTLALVLFVFGGAVLAQDRGFGNIAERQRTSTVLGGTGMFNTFATRTLYKGEFNFAVFWNNFDRDPGDIDINQIPFNFTVGLTNRWEMWVNWITWQQVTSRQPFLLSGYQYNAARLFGDPLQILGPPVGGNGRAAFFPGTGSAGGGILPALGRFSIPVGGDGLDNLNSPAGTRGLPVVGLGPAIISDRPGFFNDLPFFGVVDFLGFDGLGRPVLGPRESANGSSDVYVGTKYNLIDANRHWFSMALAGYLKIPVSRDDQARARGRTSGEFEYGPMLIFGQEFAGHRLRFYENIGYIHTGDIHRGGVKVLDLRDKTLLNIGGSYSWSKYVELLAELTGTIYAGKGTPSFERVNPWDLNLGARFFLRDGTVAFGGAYRRSLFSSDKRGVSVLECTTVIKPPKDDCPKDPHGYGHSGYTPPCYPSPPETIIECKPREVRFGEGDRNGFVGFFSVGARKECPPPPVPTCALEAAPGSVTRGERLTVSVKPTTPGYNDAEVDYQYRWEMRDARGGSVQVSGAGNVIDVPTARLVCGSYTVTAIVTATVKGSDYPECPDNSAQSTCAASFEVTEPPCPNVTCSIVSSATTVTEGDRVVLRAASTPGSNVTYRWSATGGRLSSTTGAEVTLNTTGVTRAVTVRVEVSTGASRCDQPCAGGSCSTTIAVREIPPPPPRPEIIRPCGPIFFPFNSARINNEHKACLDEIAITLQQDPRSLLVIDGHRDSAERAGISLTRANNARDYLVGDKAIAASRITVRNFSDTCPFENNDPKLNRRVEFWIIPEGASISDINAVKRCGGGAVPHVITNESPATIVEPDRPSRRAPARKDGRPEPETMLEEREDEIDSRLSGSANESPNATASRPLTTQASGYPRGARTETSFATATVVRAVSARMIDGALRIFVDTDGATQFKDFILTNPSRVVIDITGVRNAFGNKALPVISGLVDRVRIGEPVPGVVRIVVDLKTAACYRVMQDGASLVIIISDSSVASKADAQPATVNH
jgi:outer membrane protein OmpA-like peptidoglycan-associated protein